MRGGAVAAPARPAGASRPETYPPGPAAPLHGPWPDDAVWGRRWLGPARPASPATAAAIALAAAIAAVSVPMDRPGVGWLLAAVAGTVALVLGRVRPRRPPSMLPPPPVVHPAARLGPARFGWSAATVTLLAAGTLRSAGWLFVLCLLTAGFTGTLAVAGGRSLRAMLLATLMAPAAALRGAPWVVRGLARTRRPAGGVDGLRIAATVAVSAALLVVFGTLFASADATFADLLATAVPDVDAATVTRWVFVFVVTGVLLTGGAYLRAAPPDLSGLDGAGHRRVARLEWAVPLTLLVLLFGLFVAVQLAVLFGGSRHVRHTDGLTYAAYARGGFWQLLVITGLTLLVLAGAARWAPRRTRADRVLIRAVLGTLAVLTLVVVASALHRMDVYADTYGLTRLRVMVAAAEFWLGAVFLMILLAGIRLRAGWLPRAAVAAAVLALLGLAAANPDGMIAERNVTRYRQTGQIDVRYLSNLSPDAVPALNRLAGLNRVRRDCTLIEIHEAMRGDPGDWRGWSYGRERAGKLLAAEPPVRHRECPTHYAD
ncbi:DUF4153 domain-containing protein [Jidongwangia harbinensis]|uniref:DUF4153 domain-containing protein n=1 Tax=Jidongwangia harbinensis TaxID=2878561 RepID=UPI001CD98D13|nr:DUF4173 domain-containing protein [Jidongwangia harbinensis]MCA2212638.1 DUF4173 domain-containing protein [Jidongwangia harbinensis]